MAVIALRGGGGFIGHDLTAAVLAAVNHLMGFFGRVLLCLRAFFQNHALVKNRVAEGTLPLLRIGIKSQITAATWAFIGRCSHEKHLISIYDSKRAEKEQIAQNIKYHIEFFRNGLNAIIKLWLANGCKESPEEMAEVLKTEYRGR